LDERCARGESAGGMEKKPAVNSDSWDRVSPLHTIRVPAGHTGLTDGADEARARFPENGVRSVAWVPGSRF